MPPEDTSTVPPAWTVVLTVVPPDKTVAVPLARTTILTPAWFELTARS